MHVACTLPQIIHGAWQADWCRDTYVHGMALGWACSIAIGYPPCHTHQYDVPLQPGVMMQRSRRVVRYHEKYTSIAHCQPRKRGHAECMRVTSMAYGHWIMWSGVKCSPHPISICQTASTWLSVRVASLNSAEVRHRNECCSINAAAAAAAAAAEDVHSPAPMCPHTV